MIAIIDYKMGNLRSVENALQRLGADFQVTSDAAVIRRADRVLLPGVGNCGKAMENLKESNLIPVIKDLRRPVLGICVGMQVMCRDSEEGNVACIGLFDAHVRKFEATAEVKVPHVGWNQLETWKKRCLKMLTAVVLFTTSILIMPISAPTPSPRPSTDCSSARH